MAMLTGEIRTFLPGLLFAACAQELDRKFCFAEVTVGPSRCRIVACRGCRGRLRGCKRPK
jgi:hypothetical protein